MARMLFGGEIFDVYLHEDPEGDLHAYGPLVAKFYDGEDESASPIVDLVSYEGESISEVVVLHRLTAVVDGCRRGGAHARGCAHLRPAGSSARLPARSAARDPSGSQA